MALFLAEVIFSLRNDIIVHPAATFFVRMIGVAMEPTIHAGDVLIVDRAIVALDGRAVVVIFQEKFMVRRVLIEDDKITLKADNRAFLAIVAALDEIQVWGVVTYAIHKRNAPAWKRRRRRKLWPSRHNTEFYTLTKHFCCDLLFT